MRTGSLVVVALSLSMFACDETPKIITTPTPEEQEPDTARPDASRPVVKDAAVDARRDPPEDDEEEPEVDAAKPDPTKPDGAKPDATKPDATRPDDPPASRDAGVADADVAEPEPGSGSLPPVTSVADAGPYEVTILMNTGPNRGWVVHPKELGKDGVKHPLFTWGAGAGTNASNYRDHLTHWASHGFVIEAHASTGDGTDHKKALDYLIAQNEASGSPFFGKLDTSKVASGGHSQGSISTFAMADDPRLTTTLHVAGGSFDGNGSSKLKKPTAYILGASDTLATPNGQRDYTATKVPVFMTVMDGVDHIAAARQGLAPITAWLRWHLAGEDERKAQFLGADCEFCKGKYKSMSKGF
ncbi:MAG: hypothetical protein ABW352_19640 [Polyangiales bacterium]